MIASHYKHSSRVQISGSRILLALSKANGGCSIAKAAQGIGLNVDHVQGMQYQVEWQNGVVYGVYHGFNSETRVSDDRESALTFANDIANGLLKVIEPDLLTRQSKNQEALEVLNKAASGVPKRIDDFPV